MIDYITRFEKTFIPFVDSGENLIVIVLDLIFRLN